MSNICIVGGGPAGVMAAIFASVNPKNKIFIFDKGIILNTILPTGGGRCNLAYSEFNFKELASFYPRGEKFLYSVFSKFGTKQTLDFFESIGVKTYTQDDLRIFPVSDSSKDVKDALMRQLEKSNIKKIFEKVISVRKINEVFEVKTDKSTYIFDKVVIASGGRGSGHELAKSLGHNIVELRPALSSLITQEKDFVKVAGISLKNIEAQVFFENKKLKTLSGDFLFTHCGISGPLVYKISSYFAYLNFCTGNPLKIVLNLVQQDFKSFDECFSIRLKDCAKKESVNVLAEFVPLNLARFIFDRENVVRSIKAGQLSKKDRQTLAKAVTSLIFNAVKVSAGEEIVTAGGISCDEINSSTMESKLVSGLYFCGEVINVDGLTGGFNLQNCWSTGYLTGYSLSLQE